MPGAVIARLPNWLGDTVMAVPALRALRAAYPDASLVLAGPWAPALGSQGIADVLVTYPRSWSGRLRTADRVRALGADIAILFPNSLEAAIAARYWGASRRVGFATDGRDWLLTDRVPLPMLRRHQTDEYLLLVDALGITATDRVPRLRAPAVDAPERDTVRALLREAGVDPEARTARVGVHLGAEYGSSKRWPIAHVVELCRALHESGDVPVLLGAPSDTSEARRVTAAVPVASLVGRDRPDLLSAVLSEIDVLVSGDTGVAHLAAALGQPVVTLFGPTDPALTAPHGAVVVRHPVPCSPCFYRTCPIEHPCLCGVTAAQVHAEIRSLLAAEAGRT
jgi:lipopolysaccharide heptosyltransferase II